MSPGLGPETLAARALVTDIVVAYAMALDACDWAGFRALFEDEIEIDYSSLGSIQATLPADAWVERCKVLGGFDATLHKVSNFAVVMERDAARVTSYVDAAHFIRHGKRELAGFACGTYVHDLRRHVEGWKISGCAFAVAGYATGRSAFDKAFDAARAVHARQEGRP